MGDFRNRATMLNVGNPNEPVTLLPGQPAIKPKQHGQITQNRGHTKPGSHKTG